MAYVKVGPWVNGAAPAISAANLDTIETQYDEVGNLFDAHSILIAIADNTPVVLPVAASRIVGREAAGNIVALTGAEVLTIAGWTNAKFLLGAGAGIAPTEVDAPAAPTKEFFVPCHYGDTGATEVAANALFSSWDLGAATEAVYFSFKVPHDFTALTHCKVIGIKSVNGTIDWTATTSAAAIGEVYTTHADSDTGDTLAMTTNEIEEVDISAAYTNIAADDFVGTKFNLDAISAGVYYVLVLAFKYT